MSSGMNQLIKGKNIDSNKIQFSEPNTHFQTQNPHFQTESQNGHRMQHGSGTFPDGHACFPLRKTSAKKGCVCRICSFSPAKTHAQKKRVRVPDMLVFSCENTCAKKGCARMVAHGIINGGIFLAHGRAWFLRMSGDSRQR